MAIKNNIVAIVNQEGCFNLQFRKDTKHERPKSPTYYHWKAQFVVTERKSETATLEKIKKTLGCGKIYESKDQIRYSVQDIDDVKNKVIPFFKKHKLSEIKRKDFELWVKAVEIIYKNKGKYLAGWKKNEFEQLLEVQKSVQRYKERPKRMKWTKIAQDFAKTL